MLAKAVATECRTTFFNISASTLVSKWRGDSEKLVKALFEVARYHGPSTIFLDEMDAILSARGGEGGQEHEASRRMKTELLMQMDGLKASTSAAEQVFVMAASNLPWDLDTAVLRRLEKRVMVPLPGAEAREAMIRKHLHTRCAPDVDFAAFALQTEGYSGADMELLCREAAMKPVRRLMQKLQDMPDQSPPPPANGAARGGGGGGRGRAAASSGGSGGGGVAEHAVQTMLREDPVTLSDFVEAFTTTKSSSEQSVMSRYSQWQEEFGSV
jgi:katanin p60 ATPase-containing subunit A1